MSERHQKVPVGKLPPLFLFLSFGWTFVFIYFILFYFFDLLLLFCQVNLTTWFGAPATDGVAVAARASSCRPLNGATWQRCR